MALALLGLAAGFAQGAAARVKKEREDSEELVKTRLQFAAINKKKREEELNARKAALSDRYASLSPFLSGAETEQEKLALISNEAITKDFITRRTQGEAVDLKQYLVQNKDKIPEKFNSVREYINTISSPPTPQTAEQMQAAFGQQRGFLGANVGVSAGRAERIAKGLGGTTAAELLAFEGMSPVEAEPLADVARINVEMFPKQPKSIDDQITNQQSVVSAIADKYGEDDDRTKEAITRLSTLMQRKQVLDPEQQTFAKMLDRAKAKVVTAKTTEERTKAEAELDRLTSIGKEERGRKVPSATSMNNLLTDAGAKAVVREFGTLVGNGIIVGSRTDEAGNRVSTYQYVGTDRSIQQQVEAVARRAMRLVSDTWLDKEGKPLSEDLVTALAVNGVTYNNTTGRFNWGGGGGTTPPAAASGGAGAAPATRVTTPPAGTDTPGVSTPRPAIATPMPMGGSAAPVLTAPANAAPARGLASRPVDIAAERREAQAAISRGAPAADVRKRFKERTGQDL